jgi:hypothetical protein
MKNSIIKTKRFVIRKSLLGKNSIIQFTNKDGKSFKYKVNKKHFDSMKCFEKYKSYTATNNMPTFARDLVIK